MMAPTAVRKARAPAPIGRTPRCWTRPDLIPPSPWRNRPLLQRPELARKFVVSKFDLWAIRILGSVAAACFILLLVMILRVFV